MKKCRICKEDLFRNEIENGDLECESCYIKYIFVEDEK